MEVRHTINPAKYGIFDIPILHYSLAQTRLPDGGLARQTYGGQVRGKKHQASKNPLNFPASSGIEIPTYISHGRASRGNKGEREPFLLWRIGLLLKITKCRRSAAVRAISSE